MFYIKICTNAYSYLNTKKFSRGPFQLLMKGALAQFRSRRAERETVAARSLRRRVRTFAGAFRKTQIVVGAEVDASQLLACKTDRRGTI